MITYEPDVDGGASHVVLIAEFYYGFAFRVLFCLSRAFVAERDVRWGPVPVVL